MSIALALEDEQVTLEEALAFIERCESSDDTFESLASSDHSSPDVDPLVFSPCLTTSPSSSETSGWCRSETSKYTSDGSKREDCVAENPSQQAQRRDPKKRKNKARTTPKIRTRKHSKTEILTLREQVLHLTARLAQLQLYKQVPSRLSQVDENMHDDAASESPARNTSLLVANANLRNGAQIADLELQKLERSKTLNRKLKDAFERQMKLSNTLQKVFEKQIVAHSVSPPLQASSLSSRLLTPPCYCMLIAIVHVCLTGPGLVGRLGKPDKNLPRRLEYLHRVASLLGQTLLYPGRDHRADQFEEHFLCVQQ